MTSVFTTMMTNINPELFKIYGFWASVMVLKVLFMVPLIARYRFPRQVFINQDDYDFLGIKGTPKLDDPDIERVRRSHLNDLENVIPWLIVTYIWLWTNPPIFLAKTLIPTFAIARIMHTLFYAIAPMQPHRGIAFFVGLFITIYKAVSTIIYFS